MLRLTMLHHLVAIELNITSALYRAMPQKGDKARCFSCRDTITVGQRHVCHGGITSGTPSTIIADSREKLAHPYPTRPLPAGDYLVTTPGGLTILIERKSWADLAGSFTESRLQEQLWRMADSEGDRLVLLIEKSSVPINVNPILKAALSYVKARVEPVMYVAYTDSYDDTKRLLEYWRTKGDLVFYAHRPVLKAKASIDTLMALPGIGEQTKEKIARSKKFKNLGDFILHVDRAKSLMPITTFKRVRAFVKESWK